MPTTPLQVLKSQLLRCQVAGWMPYFQSAALAASFDPAFLLAIGSRETNLQNIKGDFHDGAYHGFGILQVDIHTDPEWCAGWRPEAVEASIVRGVQVLTTARRFLTAKGVTDPVALAASYNTGPGNVLRSLRGGLGADHTTTGKDYGADVVARAAVFAGLLAAPPVILVPTPHSKLSSGAVGEGLVAPT